MQAFEERRMRTKRQSSSSPSASSANFPDKLQAKTSFHSSNQNLVLEFLLLFCCKPSRRDFHCTTIPCILHLLACSVCTASRRLRLRERAKLPGDRFRVRAGIASLMRSTESGTASRSSSKPFKSISRASDEELASGVRDLHQYLTLTK